jgi:hypothetical protein
LGLLMPDERGVGPSNLVAELLKQLRFGHLPVEALLGRGGMRRKCAGWAGGDLLYWVVNLSLVYTIVGLLPPGLA